LDVKVSGMQEHLFPQRLVVLVVPGQ